MPALSIKLRKTSEVCVAFFGDGATNEGAFHEALNMASIWKLPVIFVCENNKYGMSMSTERSMAVPNVADRAVAYSMPGEDVNGNDLPLVYATVAGSRRPAPGPAEDRSLIECKTYRIRGHSKSDRNRYRTKEEIEEWRGRDPIRNLEGRGDAIGRITNHRFAAIDARVEEEMAAAIEFAIQSPSPDPSRLTDDVYA